MYRFSLILSYTELERQFNQICVFRHRALAAPHFTDSVQVWQGIRAAECELFLVVFVGLFFAPWGGRVPGGGDVAYFFLLICFVLDFLFCLFLLVLFFVLFLFFVFVVVGFLFRGTNTMLLLKKKSHPNIRYEKKSSN